MFDDAGVEKHVLSAVLAGDNRQDRNLHVALTRTVLTRIVWPARATVRLDLTISFQ